MNENESIFLSSIYTKEKLNKYKKILKYFKNHIGKVIDAIEKDVINHSILKTLIDSIENYYKEYKIDIDSIEEDNESSNEEETKESNDDDENEEEDGDNSEEEDEENNEEEDTENKEDTNEDEDNKGKTNEDTSSSINLNNESDDSDSDSSEDSKNSSSNVKVKEDILLKPFCEGELMFKKNNNSSNIYENIKTFISNSYVY